MDELKKGKEIEHEHDSTIKAIAADAKAGKLKPLEFYTKLISKDHLEEISDYYTRLIKMEDKAKAGKKPEVEDEDEDEKCKAGSDKSEKKSEREEDDERADKAFETWRATAEPRKNSDNSGSPVGSSDEPWYPQVDLERDGDCEHSVGDECEKTFKAHVHSISKTDKGHRVTYKLKEVKE